MLNKTESIRDLYSQRKDQCLKGCDVWRRFCQDNEVRSEDFVLFFPHDDKRCERAALAHLKDWLSAHRTSIAYILKPFARSERIRRKRFALSLPQRAKLVPLDGDDSANLFALYCLQPVLSTWFKVATLQGPNNIIANIDKLEDPSFDLEESFMRYLYHLEEPPRQLPGFRQHVEGYAHERAPETRQAGLLLRDTARGDVRQDVDRKLGKIEESVTVLQDIVASVEPGTFLFFANQRGAGDLMFMLQSIKAFVESNEVERYALVTNEHLNHKRIKSLALLFGMEGMKLLPVSGTEMASFRTLVPFMRDILPAHLFCSHYCGYYPGERAVLLSNRPGLRYVDFLRHACYGLPSDTPFSQRVDLYAEEDIIERYFSSGLVPGKTVVLSPTAIAGADLELPLDEQFWEKLARSFAERGFSVATNVGSDEEQPIPGTQKLFCSFSELPFVLDIAGFLVSVRSGICDLCTLSSAKQVILYPDVLFGRTQNYRVGYYSDFWTLSQLVAPERLLEIVRHSPESCDLIPLAVDFISGDERWRPQFDRYEHALRQLRGYQDRLRSCHHVNDWLDCIRDMGESSPIALAVVSRGLYTKYFCNVGFDRVGIDFPRSKEDIIKRRFIGMWDSQSGKTEFLAGMDDMALSRHFGGMYTFSAAIRTDADTGKLAFSGFSLTYESESGKRVFEFEKGDAARIGISIAAYSIGDCTVIDCVNINTGSDPLLLIRRLR